jgi:hypothetical protein
MSTTRSLRTLALLTVPGLLIAGCGDSGTTSSTGTGGSASTTTGSMTTTVSSTTTGSTSSTMSSTSSGLPPVMATDKCPGNLIDMPLDTNVSLQGTTVGASDDYKEFCGDTKAAGMGSPDVVYQFKVENRCSFFLNLSAMGPSWNPVAAIRTVCDTRNQGSDYCISGAMGGQTFKGELQAGTYSIIVDGDGSTAGGAYSMNLQCLTPKCGDGVLNTSEEQCDLGPNPAADSGCGAPGTPNACKLTPRPAADTCADIATTAAATVNITTTATTANPLVVPAAKPIFDMRVANQDYIASCSTPAASNGPGLDQVFKFVPATSGTLSVTIGKDASGMDYCQPPNYDQPECWVHTMWFQSVCMKEPASMPQTFPLELPAAGQVSGTGCVHSDVSTNYVDTATVSVVANQPYYLFVQGQTTDKLIQGENGPYILRATLQ